MTEFDDLAEGLGIDPKPYDQAMAWKRKARKEAGRPTAPKKPPPPDVYEPVNTYEDA